MAYKQAGCIKLPKKISTKPRLRPTISKTGTVKKKKKEKGYASTGESAVIKKETWSRFLCARQAISLVSTTWFRYNYFANMFSVFTRFMYDYSVSICSGNDCY